MAQNAKKADIDGYRTKFIALMKTASKLKEKAYTNSLQK